MGRANQFSPVSADMGFAELQEIFRDLLATHNVVQ